ncbi:MAG: hypothetical protein JRI83_10155 [Deltaproteobacteria bacterium]|nr:hypothetical protein [Deltaproteobacteria bacterium]
MVNQLRSKRNGSKKTKTINFEYKISPNFAIYSISGAYGGINAQGQINANFFFERPAIPKTITYSLEPDGQLGEELKEDKKDAIIRDILFGISMTPNTAKSLAVWLLEKVEKHEKTFQARKKE